MKTAIVLFNLGGPDGPAAVRPFRVNLFMDRAIRVGAVDRRADGGGGGANYALMGGKSPLLELTGRQAAALQTAVGGDTRTFIAMRYWHPFAAEAALAVKAWDPDRVLLLPLYPQFSTTTTGSSVADWHEQAAKAGLMKPMTTLCCYFDNPAYVAAVAALVRAKVAEAKAARPGLPLRLLFSAHGLPESIVKAGDPYQWQVERSVAAVLEVLADPSIEHVVCYQSRATPQKWIEPSTMAEIERAGRNKIAVLLVPIAFVSDHIETLVELDIENRELAQEVGVPAYFRAAVPNDDPAFIAALAGLVARAVAHGDGLCSHAGSRVCPQGTRDCPWTKHAGPG